MKNVVRVENGSMIFGQGGSGGSGGHTIQNDSGTALPQESALQFVGVYSEDDSTNHKTKVNIVREMTKAQMDALSTDAKKGVIHTTDEPDNPANPISAEDVSYGSGTIKDALDNLKGLTLIEETPSIATNGQYTVRMTDIPVNRIVEFVFMISYTEAFQYCSVHTLPKVSSTYVRMYHYINSGSVGALQYFYNGSTDIQLINQINESVKVRLYARYI